jgi:hypothetical protein
MSTKSAGLDLRRPRSAGEVLHDTLRCYGAFPVLFAALALAVVVPYGLAVRLIEGDSLIRPTYHGAGVSVAMLLLVTLVVTPLISALHIHALAALDRDEQPRVGPLFMRGLRVLPVVAAAATMAGLGVGLGLICLIVPGVILYARWAVVAQVAALEGLNWSQSLGRSGKLTRGNYLHCLGVLLSLGIVSTLLARGAGALAGPGADAAQVLLGIAVDTIVLSLTALATAVLYYDLVARASEPARIN